MRPDLEGRRTDRHGLHPYFKRHVPHPDPLSRGENLRLHLNDLQSIVALDRVKIRRIVRNILAQESRSRSGSISVTFLDDRAIAVLNRAYHHTKGPTDVLAFDLGSAGSGMQADIFISTQTACANARRFKTSPGQELDRYVIHGMLHILGYRDRTPREKKLMRSTEDHYLGI